MIRLFVGVPVSEEVKKKIKPTITELQELRADLNLVPLENLHFTVKFLGEVDEDEILEIREMLDSIKLNKFKIKLSKIGAFPSLDRINVIWIGSESQEFISLMKEVDNKLNYIKKNDFKKGVAHLTIARVKSGKNKDKLQEFVKKYAESGFGEMIVDKFFLYKSTLTPSGPVYTSIAEYLLKDL